MTKARSVDRGSPVPLWAQVLSDLRGRVAAGEFDERFPTDEQLRAEYGVSRQTIREAARRLQGDGVIVRERGRGSTLATSPVEQPLHTLYSLARTAQEQGLSEHSEVRRLERIPAGESRGPLGLADGDTVVYVERLRFVGDEPLSLHRSWLPYERAEGLLDADLRSGSLYDALGACCGVRVTGGWERIQPELPTGAMRRLLGVPDGQAVLVVDRLAIAGSTPVEWRRSVVRGDRYAFRAEWSAT
ncbi:MAG: GntR family transcriptional regulator [Actinomycetota bacterium]|nr:GntR family transcriptional regulator [Actinomycetota bacterium]